MVGGEPLSPRFSDAGSVASIDSVSSLGTAVLGDAKERKPKPVVHERQKEPARRSGRRTPSATLDFQEGHWLSDSSLSSNSDGEDHRRRDRRRDGAATPEREVAREKSRDRGGARRKDKLDDAEVAAKLAKLPEVEEKLKTYKRRLTEAKEKNAAMKAEHKTQLERRDAALRKAESFMDSQDKGGGVGVSKEELAAKAARIAELEEGLRGWERIVDTMRREQDQERKKGKEERDGSEKLWQEQLQQLQDKLKKSDDELAFKRNEVQELQDILVASGLNDGSNRALDEVREALRDSEEKAFQREQLLDEARADVADWRSRAERAESSLDERTAGQGAADDIRRGLEDSLAQAISEAAERASTIEELERELLRLRSEQPQHNAETDSLRQDVARLAAEVQEATAEADELRRSSARCRGERDALSRDLEQALAVRDEAANESSGLSSALAETKARAEALQEEVALLRAKEGDLAAVEDRLKSESTDNALIAQEQAKQLERMEERLQECEQLNDERAAEIAQLRVAAADKDREQDALRAELSSIRRNAADDAGAASERCSLLEARVQAESAQLSSAREEVKRLRTALEGQERAHCSLQNSGAVAAREWEERTAALEREAEETEAELSLLRDKVGELTATNTDLVKRVLEADTAADACRDALSEHERHSQERLASLEARLMESGLSHEQELSKVEESRREMAAAQAKADSEAQEARNEIRRLTEGVSAQRAMASEQCAQAEEQREKVAELEVQLSEALERASSLQHDYDRIRAAAVDESTEAEAANQSLRARIEELEREAAGHADAVSAVRRSSEEAISAARRSSDDAIAEAAADADQQKRGRTVAEAESEELRERLRESEQEVSRLRELATKTTSKPVSKPSGESTGGEDSERKVIELEEKVRLLEAMQGKGWDAASDALSKHRLLWDLEGRIVRERQDTLKWKREAESLGVRIHALQCEIAERRGDSVDRDDDARNGQSDLAKTAARLRRNLSKIKDQVAAVNGDASEKAPAREAADIVPRTPTASSAASEASSGSAQPMTVQEIPPVDEGSKQQQSDGGKCGFQPVRRVPETKPAEMPQRSQVALSAAATARRALGMSVAEKYQKYRKPAGEGDQKLVRDRRASVSGLTDASLRRSSGYLTDASAGYSSDSRAPERSRLRTGAPPGSRAQDYQRSAWQRSSTETEQGWRRDAAERRSGHCTAATRSRSKGGDHNGPYSSHRAPPGGSSLNRAGSSTRTRSPASLRSSSTLW